MEPKNPSFIFLCFSLHLPIVYAVSRDFGAVSTVRTFLPSQNKRLFGWGLARGHYILLGGTLCPLRNLVNNLSNFINSIKSNFEVSSIRSICVMPVDLPGDYSMVSRKMHQKLSSCVSSSNLNFSPPHLPSLCVSY